jgi:hypothetical protein
MGVDIAVCFTPTHISCTALVETSAVQNSNVSELYIVQGFMHTLQRDIPFFALWADAPVDLHTLCSELSNTTHPLLITWKVEHGGVGGYVAYVQGNKAEDIASSDEEYIGLLTKGFETTFNTELPFSEEDRAFFPELLLDDDDVECFHVQQKGGTITAESHTTVIRLLEEDLAVQPIVPVDIW